MTDSEDKLEFCEVRRVISTCSSRCTLIVRNLNVLNDPSQRKQMVQRESSSEICRTDWWAFFHQWILLHSLREWLQIHLLSTVSRIVMIAQRAVSKMSLLVDDGEF